MRHRKETPQQPRPRGNWLRWVSLILGAVVLSAILVVLWGQDQKSILSITNETIDQELFDEYIYNQRLTGAVIVDENLELVQESSTDGDSYAYWHDMLHSDNVSAILDYPAKSYMTRVERDGQSYDVAAVTRSGAKGVVLAYYERHEIITGSGDHHGLPAQRL